MPVLPNRQLSGPNLFSCSRLTPRMDQTPEVPLRRGPGGRRGETAHKSKLQAERSEFSADPQPTSSDRHLFTQIGNRAKVG